MCHDKSLLPFESVIQGAHVSHVKSGHTLFAEAWICQQPLQSAWLRVQHRVRLYMSAATENCEFGRTGYSIVTTLLNFELTLKSNLITWITLFHWPLSLKVCCTSSGWVWSDVCPVAPVTILICDVMAYRPHLCIAAARWSHKNKILSWRLIGL